MEKTSTYVSNYKKHLEKDDLQKTYEILLKYVMSLKAHCLRFSLPKS